MTDITATARLSADPSAVFAELLAFGRHLGQAPAVQAVEIDGEGGVGTRYRVSLTRFGRQGTVVATVTEVEAPSSVAWRGERAIDGHWRVEPSGTGSTVSIDLTLDDSVLDQLPLTGRLLGRGIESILSRLFRRELIPVLESIAATAEGGDSAVELVDVSIE